MGGSCICLNIKQSLLNSGDFEVNKQNLPKKNDQSSINKNNISSITNKKANNLFNTEEEKNNMVINDSNYINNGNSGENSIISENSKSKDNNPLDSNYQINDDLINNEIICKNNSPSNMDQIINNNRGRTLLINGVENVESATPKMAIGKSKLEEKTKGKKKAFSHFFQNNTNENNPKNAQNNNNQPLNSKKENSDLKDYMNKYSEEMIIELNSIRKNPEYFIQSIDDIIKNDIQRLNDDIFIVSKNIDEKVKIMEYYFLVFEQIKGNLREIVNSKNLSKLEEFKYNEELAISLNDIQEITNKENSNNQIIQNSSIINKKDSNSIFDLSDDKISALILNKRKKIKNKYPENVFKTSIVRDIKISILIQISKELMDDQFDNKKLLNEIIFNPIYKNFAVSWANEINRKFISISCFA